MTIDDEDKLFALAREFRTNEGGEKMKKRQSFDKAFKSKVALGDSTFIDFFKSRF